MGGPVDQDFPALSMSRVTSIADGQEWLEELKDFAIAQGWSAESYQTNVQWGDTGGGVYGWVAGTGDFLQLYSTGYNATQKLRYRFYAAPGTSETTITWQMIDPAYSAVSSAISNLPYSTTAHHCVCEFAQSQVISLPDSSFPGCWFIGNDRFIAWEAEVASGTALVSGAIGTFDLMLEYQNIAGELACRWPGFYRSTGIKWNQYGSTPQSFLAPGAYLGHTGNVDLVTYWRSAGRSGDGADTAVLAYAATCVPAGDTPASWTSGSFGRDSYIVQYSLNSYSNKRVLVKPKIMLRDADGKWMPAGTMPLYNTSVAGLAMGEQITYGGRTFICFPNGIGTYTYGHCYDIT